MPLLSFFLFIIKKNKKLYKALIIQNYCMVKKIRCIHCESTQTYFVKKKSLFHCVSCGKDFENGVLE